MNKYLKKLIIIAFLIGGISILSTSCETELDNELTKSKERLTIKHITLKELQKKGNYAKIVKSFSKAIKQNLKNNSEKGIFSNDGTFYVHTDFIYETSTDSVTNYTFRIERVPLDSLKMENLIISKNNNTNNIQLRIIEFSKNNGIYNSVLYNIETNNINLDSLQLKSQEVYIYGTQMFVDDCVTVVYDPCSGNGNDDGHAPTSNCGGSPTTLSYENCEYIAPDGESSGGGGGGTSTTHSPNSNSIGAFTIIDKTDYYGSFLKSNSFNLGTAERSWLDAHNLQKQLLKDFINENKANSPANAFGAAAVEAWMGGGRVDLDDRIIIAPDLEIDFPCQSQIIFDVLQSNSPLTKSILDVFGDDTNGYNLVFDINTLLSPPFLAGTNPTSLDSSWNIDMLDIEIGYSNFLLGRSDLAIASVTVHESLHALLVYLVETNQITNTDSNWNLSQLAQEYADNRAFLDSQQLSNSGNLNVFDADWLNSRSHEYMTNLVRDMATSISAFGIQKGYNLPFSYYEALAWHGVSQSETYTDIVNEADDGDEESQRIVDLVNTAYSNEFLNPSNTQGHVCN